MVLLSFGYPYGFKTLCGRKMPRKSKEIKYRINKRNEIKRKRQRDKSCFQEII